MKNYFFKSCKRCGESMSVQIGSQYQCHSCGLTRQEIKTHQSQSVESLEDQVDRTLDLVEIFNFIGKKRTKS